MTIGTLMDLTHTGQIIMLAGKPGPSEVASIYKDNDEIINQ
jgi:hypothetical protein